ncbi:MAG: DNA-directed RNA polymerase subunit L [Candidatus Diapherotrites archaeon]
MKIEIISKEKSLIEFKLIGERHTVPNLLKAKLVEGKDVEFVSYKLNHPLDTDSVFVLRMAGGKDPVKALSSAVKEIQDELDEFTAKLKKAL